jgi:transposase
MTIGIDLGDRFSQVCVLDTASREVADRFSVATTRAAFAKRLGALGPSRVVLEVGTHSGWASRELERQGHEVIVANPRKVRLISANEAKSDRADSETLARLGAADVALLHPVRPRDPRTLEHLGVLRARDRVVAARTALINHVRGRVKASGSRLPAAGADAFARKVAPDIPAELRPALEPVLELIENLGRAIRHFDREVERICEKERPETALLQQVPGVGPVTSLAYVLVLDRHERFRSSRMVGPYLGLCPRRAQSGDRDPQLRITKAGNSLLRRLLVGSAQYILGPFAPDSTLRRAGQRLMTAGGCNAKKRAVVAVARRLAALLHHLWRSAESYDPLRGVPPPAAAAS